MPSAVTSLSSVRLSQSSLKCFIDIHTKWCLKLSLAAAPAEPISDQSGKVVKHSSHARFWCNTTHLPPSLLLLSSCPCLPKIGQLWTMWPQVTGEGLHQHTRRQQQVWSHCGASQKKKGLSGPYRKLFRLKYSKHLARIWTAVSGDRKSVV